LVGVRLTEADHASVTAAVAEAERGTDGEIVTVVAGQSDAYHDIALHWAVLAMLLVLTLFSVWPQAVEWLYGLGGDAWTSAVPVRALFTIALIAVALAFLLVRVLLASTPLRMALTPGGTKARRVRRRAVQLFRTAAEQRTRARTGVLLYLSLDERRAEIVADESIHSRVAPETWGEAMAALVEAVRQGRPGDGMAAAVTRIGDVLAEHFPRSEDDVNELPDRLIEL
jgi:putative membrane protein